MTMPRSSDRGISFIFLIVGTGLPDGPHTILCTALLLCIELVLLPSKWILKNILQMSIEICLIPDHMIIRSALPNIFTIFLVAESLQCGNKSRNDRVLQCRGRYSRRSVFFYTQQNMDVIGHNHITFHRNILIKIVKLVYVFDSNFSIRKQFNFRTVQEAGPYNAG